MTEFNKEKMARARQVIEAALKEAGTIIGAEMKLGNIRFTKDSFDAKITANRINTLGEVMVDPIKEAKAKMALRMTNRFEFPVDQAIGRKAMITGVPYEVTIVDFNSRAKKCPFIVKTGQGTLYRVAARGIEKLL